MKNTLETRLGMFVSLSVLCAIIILEVVGGGLEYFRRGTRVAALFNNVLELKVGDSVKMAGVPVGRVEELKLAEGKVKVIMKLKPDFVKTDSKATIKFAGLLGQNYVGIDFGSEGAPVAGDGTIIASSEQADLNALMGKLDNVASGVENLTKSFTGDKIDNLLGPLTDFLKQNSGSLTTTFANLKTVTTQIADGKGTVGRMIFDDALYTNLQDTATEAKATLSSARQIVEQINSGQGAIGKMVKDDRLYSEITESMTILKEILEKVNTGEGSVGKMVNDPALYKNANLTLQKLDKATESLEDQGVISVLGIAVGKLF